MKSGVVLFSVITLLILQGCSSADMTKYQNKSIKELMVLDTPVHCAVNAEYVNNLKTMRKSNTALTITTDYWIDGDTVKEQGVAIWTDGREYPAADIFDREDQVIYMSLSYIGKSSLNDWWAEIRDKNFLQAYAQVYDDSISRMDSALLGCVPVDVDDTFFKPVKVCYQDKTPNCNVLVQSSD